MKIDAASENASPAMTAKPLVSSVPYTSGQARR